MKLVSMIDFVDNIDYKLINPKSNREHELMKLKAYEDIQRYKDFLNQPLNLGMFVPAIEVDGKWEVVSELQVSIYQQAKDRVLFEGFEIKKNIYVRNGLFTISFLRDNEIWEINRKFKTINDLIKYAPTLTAKGQELSGLNK
jgi:hypothetical protein